MRPYLEEKTFPDLRLSIRDLLKTIAQNQELDRYWGKMERQNNKVIRAARRAEADRKRLEQGSQYNTDEEEKLSETEDSQEEDSSDYDSEYDDEEPLDIDMDNLSD